MLSKDGKFPHSGRRKLGHFKKQMCSVMQRHILQG